MTMDSSYFCLARGSFKKIFGMTHKRATFFGSPNHTAENSQNLSMSTDVGKRNAKIVNMNRNYRAIQYKKQW